MQKFQSKNLSAKEKERYFDSLRVIDESKRVDSKPTTEQISTLKQGDYYVFGNTIYINIAEVGDQMSYECPFCYSRYKQNGIPYKRAKRRMHYHGTRSTKVGYYNDGKLPHCYNFRAQHRTNPIGYTISLHVTETTKGATRAPAREI